MANLNKCPPSSAPRTHWHGDSAQLPCSCVDKLRVINIGRAACPQQFPRTRNIAPASGLREFPFGYLQVCSMELCIRRLAYIR